MTLYFLNISLFQHKSFFFYLKICVKLWNCLDSQLSKGRTSNTVLPNTRQQQQELKNRRASGDWSSHDARLMHSVGEHHQHAPWPVGTTVGVWRRRTRTDWTAVRKRTLNGALRPFDIMWWGAGIVFCHRGWPPTWSAHLSWWAPRPSRTQICPPKSCRDKPSWAPPCSVWRLLRQAAGKSHKFCFYQLF